MVKLEIDKAQQVYDFCESKIINIDSTNDIAAQEKP
jgi:hypothetical protein